MNWYLLIKWLHVITSTVLLGTGAGIAFFILVGCCWLPVLWLQIRMRDMAASAASAATPLPPAFKRYYGLWVALGWPAFIGVLGIFYLMVAKPMF
jgi:uncharacterized membrane protein